MEIGLISLSGLVVQDENVLRTFSLPGMRGRGAALKELPNLGLLTLARLIPAHHTIQYVELADASEVERVKHRFDLAAISCWSARIEEAFAVSDELRACGTKTVMGGQHVSYYPEAALRHCDAVCIGEGESTWQTIIGDAERNQLKASYGSLEQSFDICQAPLPRFDLLPEHRRKRFSIQMSRGCPHRCEFCAASVLIARQYKHKPVALIEREVELISDLARRPFIEFVDDNAFCDRKSALPVLALLKRKDIRWFAETDISIADDERLLDEIAASGCVELLIGLESPQPASLKQVELRSDWKYRTHQKQLDAIRRIQSRGIRVLGCFTIGFDGDQIGIAARVIERVREMELSDVQITCMTPFPGTPLRDRLATSNRILRDDPAACTLFDVAFEPAQMSATELQSELQYALEKLYAAPEYNARRRIYKKLKRNCTQHYERH